MKDLLIKFCIIIPLYFLTGCCSHYIDQIKRVINPMKPILTGFVSTYNKYPTDQQRDELLQQSGCIIIDKHRGVCKKNGKTFEYGSNIEISKHLYMFSIVKNGDFCNLYINEDGKIEEFKCIKDSCIHID